MRIRKLVSVVDDDESVREALPDLLRSFGLEAASFASASAWIIPKKATSLPNSPGRNKRCSICLALCPMCAIHHFRRRLPMKS